MPNDGFEAAAVALANFSQLHTAYKTACDAEAVRAAEKAAADAELSLASVAKDQADASAETALAVMLAALEGIGLKPAVPVPPVG